MLEPNEWRNKIYLSPPDKMYDLYYKVCCYWNAKTELYDCNLIGYEYYDGTCIVETKYRKYSNEYSRQIFMFCQHVLICECEKPFDDKLWKRINNNKHTARQWIKEYERMASSGELDFIEKYKNQIGDIA